ncbi:MAG: 30S ribosomal protein S3 [Candidatus Altiarchaeota archaeon]|nr:30S ribosomal protein S3 [Candidatus Altiarchaeota archaeon]
MTSRNFFIKQAKTAHDIVEYLRGELKFAGFSDADIKKTPLGTRITIYAVRPGLVIGSGGANVKSMTATIEKRFKVENPHVEVEQVDDIFLDPHIVAWRIAKALEKGSHFKRISSIMIQRIIQSGARGVEIRLSGKLPSKRAKTWKFTAGNPRKCGQEVVDHAKVGYEVAIKKLGVIGVRVMIIPPGVRFSDEIFEIVIEEEVKEDVKVKKTEEKVEVKPKEELEVTINKEVPLPAAEGETKEKTKAAETKVEVVKATEAKVEAPKATVEKTETKVEDVKKTKDDVKEAKEKVEKTKPKVEEVKPKVEKVKKVEEKTDTKEAVKEKKAEAKEKVKKE